MKTRIFLLFTALLYAGCAVGPNYQRPDIQAPVAFRAPTPLPPQEAASIADLVRMAADLQIAPEGKVR